MNFSFSKILLLGVIILHCGCEQVLDFEYDFNAKKPVIYAILEEGKSPVVTQTLSFGPSYNAGHKFVDEVKVCFKHTSSSQIICMEYDSVASYQLFNIANTRVLGYHKNNIHKPFWNVFKSADIIVDGTYELTVDVPNYDVAHASVEMPISMKIDTVELGRDPVTGDLIVNIRFDDPSNSTDYYMLQVARKYCTDTVDNDVYDCDSIMTDNAQNVILHSSLINEFYSQDSAFLKNSELFEPAGVDIPTLNQDPFSSTDGIFSDERFDGNSYSLGIIIRPLSGMNHVNDFKVVLMRISKSVYQYYHDIMVQSLGTGGSLSLGGNSDVYSNIENGFGIMGAVSRDEWLVEVE